MNFPRCTVLFGSYRLLLLSKKACIVEKFSTYTIIWDPRLFGTQEYDTFIEMFYCYVLKVKNICTLLCKNFDHFWYICVSESKLGFFKNHRRIFTLKKKRILVKLSRQLQCATFNLTYFSCYSVFLMFWIQGPKSGFPTFWPRFAKQSRSYKWLFWKLRFSNGAGPLWWRHV